MAVTLERPALAEAPIARVKAGGRTLRDDRLAVETPIAFIYNCESHAVMMASPRDLTDFAIGFSISEGIVDAASDISAVVPGRKGPGVTLSITIPDARAKLLGTRKRNMAGRTGCGLCGVAEIEQALRPLPDLPNSPDSPVISSAAIARALAALPEEQSLNREVGAVHAAAFAAADGTLLCVREDVGRHNALDKLIGAAARRGLDPRSGFVVVTSRCSMEMVQKTATFGCPVLVAVSAATSLAVELAEKCNLTVAAFARGDSYNLYSHPERIA